MTGSAILGVLTHTAGHATFINDILVSGGRWSSRPQASNHKRDIIYAHELQLVDMGGEHNEEAVQQEDLCYHAHAMGNVEQWSNNVITARKWNTRPLDH